MNPDKLLKLILLFVYCSFCFSCSKDSPQDYFNAAVLNTNILAGFANNGMVRQLDAPSTKLDASGKEQDMKRSEIINSKIQIIETDFEKVKALKPTDETKDMISASLSLYNYVLPVYKTEYVQLAQLFDSNAPSDQIESLTNTIQEKYSAGFKEHYDKLIEIGKVYAAKNNIKVNWGVN